MVKNLKFLKNFFNIKLSNKKIIKGISLMIIEILIDVYAKFCKSSIKEMEKKIKHREVMLEKIQKFVDN